MADRLERELDALPVDWPSTPDLAAAVVPRLRARRRPWRRRAAAVLAVLVAGGLAASPAARSALGDLLGLHGAQVRRAPPPPHPREHLGRLGTGLRLGRAVTLAEARRAVRFRLAVPLGAPDAVWLAAAPGLPARVSLVYGRRAGVRVSRHTNVALLITEFRARVAALEKSVGAGARLTRIALPHGRAYAITGIPHGFAWVGADGVMRFEDRRLAGGTLLVERDDGILVRVEGELPLAALQRLARGLAG